MQVLNTRLSLHCLLLLNIVCPALCLLPLPFICFLSNPCLIVKTLIQTLWSVFGPAPCHWDQVFSWWQDWLNYCTEDTSWLLLADYLIAPFPVYLNILSVHLFLPHLMVPSRHVEWLNWWCQWIFWFECRFLFAFIPFSTGPIALLTYSAALTAHFLWSTAFL